MTAAYLPSILVPIIGIIFPGFVMAFAFMYIEQDEDRIKYQSGSMH